MTIVAPLDGSSFAERALPWARRLTQTDAATLVLVRSVASHVQHGAARPDDGAIASADAERYLRDSARRLLPGVRVETAVYVGPPAEAILDAARRWRADVLVMATHSRPPLAGLLYGSVARALLQQSPTPILLIRSWSPAVAEAATEPARRILVPLDGSPFGEEALPPALAIAQTLHASLALVRVALAPERLFSGAFGLLLAATEPDEDERVADVRRYLDGVRQRLSALAPDMPVQIEARVGDPLHAVVAAERDHAAAIVVMATHGRGGLSHALLGSIAEGVLHAGAAPVVFVRPRAFRRGLGNGEQAAKTVARLAAPPRPMEPEEFDIGH